MQFQRFASFTPRADFARLEAALSPSATPPEHHEGSWYEIQNSAGPTAEIRIDGDIGSGGVTGGDFARALAGIRAQRITVVVNSGGGDVFHGFAIYNAIARHPAEVTAYVESIAASAASYLIMAADRVVMAKRSQLMIHPAHGIVMGNAADLRKTADVLAKYDLEIAATYADKAGGTVDEWLARMQAETWMTAQEARDLGLADEIYGAEPRNEAPRVTNEAPPEPEPTPEPPVELPVKPVNWRALFEDIADEAWESQFASKETTP